MLLSHQSSITEGSMYSDFLNATYYKVGGSPPPVREFLVPGGSWYSPDAFINHAPGSYFSYSNVNYGLIGTLIESLTC
jgi:CubicO group peptidase (beta-lactamase class C family)